ncbi:MAG: 50S ribosomal protein L4 [Candidatus Magasanikbacteria bacterium GW2011_GWA2_56_11]|uniref:Large ribosomal subunit protein uL4 n=1 Tax=Candidatus Magasanikbacteria bacterium GW2011_GWA2_56_11 TaxID=1619044 RepID=A0A0G1YG73_9BACT|nr:MAG: 50S ribosomal protein L4 [Candidatus Magasanikbacteria bacterium GW2011_GWA2_56_11]
MTKVKVYNPAGEAVREIELPAVVFGISPKSEVVHQVYTAQIANEREPWADTKDRGEVRGGGKKPWKQKGTGRARHGSIRSPIWKGGGVTFGPLSWRNYAQKINRKMKQLAVKMCLADKASNGTLVVLTELPSDGKTKSLAELRRRLPGDNRRAVVLTAEYDAAALRAGRNVPQTQVREAREVSVVDLLRFQYVIATEAAIKVLAERLTR